MKGALESVLTRCSYYLQHGMVQPLAGTSVANEMIEACRHLGEQEFYP